MLAYTYKGKDRIPKPYNKIPGLIQIIINNNVPPFGLLGYLDNPSFEWLLKIEDGTEYELSNDEFSDLTELLNNNIPFEEALMVCRI